MNRRNGSSEKITESRIGQEMNGLGIWEAPCLPIAGCPTKSFVDLVIYCSKRRMNIEEPAQIKPCLDAQ